MPSTAITVLHAKKMGVSNFSLFCNHLTTVSTIKAILDSPDMQIDAFIAPGHVSMVVGEAPFKFVSEHYNKPLVITGFEPIDILQSLHMAVVSHLKYDGVFFPKFPALDYVIVV